MTEEIQSENTDSTVEGESSEEVIENVDGDEGVEQTEETEESGEGEELDGVEQQEPVQPQYYTTIVNGREERVTLDQLLGERQKARASADKFQQASAKEKRTAEREERLVNDPISVMREAGMSDEAIKKFFYDQTGKFLDEDEMDPNEKRLRDIEEENKRLKAAEEDRQKEAQTAEERKEQAREEQVLEQEFVSVLGTLEITPTPQAVQRIAQIMSTAINNEYDMSVAEAAELYQDEQADLLSSLLGGLTPEQLELKLGKDSVNALRKHSISKVKNPAPAKDLPKQKTTNKPKKVSMEDFFN